jgi:lipopolysaccharide export LptBFGC system permease protein LptF
MAAWSENCKWYSSVPLGEIVLLMSFAAITLCVASQRVFIIIIFVVFIVVVFVYFVIDSVQKLLDTAL